MYGGNTKTIAIPIIYTVLPYCVIQHIHINCVDGSNLAWPQNRARLIHKLSLTSFMYRGALLNKIQAEEKEYKGMKKSWMMTKYSEKG